MIHECKSGLPDDLFSNQNPNLGKFWIVFKWKVLVYFMAFGRFYDPLVYFVAIW
jgi:hypothetical protein